MLTKSIIQLFQCHSSRPLAIACTFYSALENFIFQYQAFAVFLSVQNQNISCLCLCCSVSYSSSNLACSLVIYSQETTGLNIFKPKKKLNHDVSMYVEVELYSDPREESMKNNHGCPGWNFKILLSCFQLLLEMLGVPDDSAVCNHSRCKHNHPSEVLLQ